MGPQGIRTLDRRIKKSVAPASKLRGKRRPQATYRPKAHTYVSVAPVRALTATMGGAVNPTAINFLSRSTKQPSSPLTRLRYRTDELSASSAELVDLRVGVVRSRCTQEWKADDWQGVA